MKLIMAVSSDGFVARGEDDDMSWTGPDDKAVFKLLTTTSDVLAVSAKTLQYMPKELPGRGKLYALSTMPGRGVSLEDLAPIAPDAWLLGGQELALFAMKNGYVTKAYVCISPATIGSGMEDKIQPYFNRRRYQKGAGAWWDRSMRVKMGAAMVDIWDRHSAVNG